jgi:hypothetical protein
MKLDTLEAGAHRRSEVMKELGITAEHVVEVAPGLK